MDARERVRLALNGQKPDRIPKALGPGGLLLAPAYDVDFAPLRNLAAFAEAVEEYGRL